MTARLLTRKLAVPSEERIELPMNKTIALATVTTALAAATISALAMTAVANAAEQPKVTKALFKVTVEGVQKDKWDNYHEGTGGCDGTVSSSGTETLRFHSKPVTIEATDLEGLSNPVLRKAGKDVVPYPFKLSGTVKRQSTIVASPTPRWCGGVGGGTPPKDCGTKSFRGMKAGVNYFLAKPYGRIQVQSEGSMDDPFRNCGPGTQGFPNLLAYKNGTSPILSELPREELFDKSLGKIIVIGRGKSVQKGDETFDEASIRWEVTFKRIKR
jgi:hypothetical protein